MLSRDLEEAMKPRPKPAPPCVVPTGASYGGKDFRSPCSFGGGDFSPPNSFGGGDFMPAPPPPPPITKRRGR